MVNPSINNKKALRHALLRIARRLCLGAGIMGKTGILPLRTREAKGGSMINMVYCHINGPGRAPGVCAGMPGAGAQLVLATLLKCRGASGSMPRACASRAAIT
ncbi:hypothetical protein CD932_25025 [Janthinobacterium sp. PC23-8]|nr:hypothetical protein CD932_25025 [Janthinobacterium sp. PC23-8]